MTKDTWKKEITEAEYLQLCGLMVLANQAKKAMTNAERAMREVLSYESDFDDTSCGHLSDAVFDDSPNVKTCLKNMGVKIIKNGHKTKH